MGAKAICSILASEAVAIVAGVGHVREWSSRIRMGVEAISLRLASVTVADDTIGIWARQGERRVQILWVSIGILVHVPCSYLWYPDVMTRSIWESDAVIVSGAGREGTFGRLRTAWIHEGGNGVILGMICDPWIRKSTISRCSMMICRRRQRHGCSNVGCSSNVGCRREAENLSAEKKKKPTHAQLQH